jgi:ribose-phosphate pyrophosphokinase
MNFKIFNGSTSENLTDAICAKIGCEKGNCTVDSFADGEIKIKINDTVRDKVVFIIQSITSTKTKSVNDALMELYLMIRTMKRASAKKVIAIIPYFGYSRQDRKTEPRVPISASDVAMMLETAGADRVVALELHCGQIQGFFRDIPCDNIYTSCLLADCMVNDSLISQSDLSNMVVVSPDAGGVSRAKSFKQMLSIAGIESEFAIIVKERDIHGQLNNMNLVGDVKGKNIVIVDDICDTGGTLLKAIEELKLYGADKIYVCITHPVFSANAIHKIKDCKHIEKMYVTDTIDIDNNNNTSNINQVSCSELIGKVIHIFVNGGSLNSLFISEMPIQTI